jgi:hypothetical protein
MNKKIVIIGALVNSLVCFSMGISTIPFERLIPPTPTVERTKIVLPTIIPTTTPTPIPTVNPFRGEVYQEDLFDFIFDFSDEYELILDQEYTDLITDNGTRMFYVRFINPVIAEGEIDSLRYSIIYHPEISDATIKYNESYNTLLTGEEYTLGTETTILDNYPVSFFLKNEGEDGYELRFISRIKNIYVDTTGSTTISPLSDRETSLKHFMEIMNKYHFRVIDELSRF